MLNVFTSIIFALLFILIAAAVIIALHYFMWFHWHQCPHCFKTMHYNEKKTVTNDESYYIFHCPHCGATEAIPTEKFLTDIDQSPLDHSNP
jgi:hypothetical protein